MYLELGQYIAISMYHDKNSDNMGIDVLVTYHNTFNVLKGLSIFFV